MPADTLSAWDMERMAEEGSSFSLAGKGNRTSYMFLPYPMLWGGLERRSSKEGVEPFHEIGGGGGLRLAYDSLLMLSVDAFMLSQEGPGYWSDALAQPDVTPGYGLKDGKRVQRYSGQLRIRPSKHFKFSLGRGQHFFGNGHRSLLLSHNSDVHPYLRIDSEFERFHYVNLFSRLEDIRGGGSDRRRESKYAAFHYLSFEPSDAWSIGLFESVLWQGRDSLSPRGFDPQYLNPVIFYRPVEYAQGSADRVLIGADIAYRPFDGFELYGQLALDEFLLEEVREGRGWWGNKYGLQGGFHWKKPLGLSNLSWRSEFNTVRPYTYSHASPVQSYTHRGSPLAHPLGANFLELLSILEWEKGAWLVQGKGLYARYGEDPSRTRSFGRSPFKPYQWRVNRYGNRVGQGKARELFFAELQGSYLLDRASGLRAGLSLRARELRRKKLEPQRDLMASIFLRSSLFPRYTDF